MESNLIQRLRRVNDRLNELPDRLGIPQYQNVVIQTGNTQTLLHPRPQVHSVSPRLLQQYLGSSVEVNVTDFQVKYITREYSEYELSKAIWILNATESTPGSNIYTGLQGRCVDLDRSELMYYNAIVHISRGR